MKQIMPHQAGCGDWGGEVRTYQKKAEEKFPAFFNESVFYRPSPS